MRSDLWWAQSGQTDHEHCRVKGRERRNDLLCIRQVDLPATLELAKLAASKRSPSARVILVSSAKQEMGFVTFYQTFAVLYQHTHRDSKVKPDAFRARI
jgi:hypothetical protein